MTQSLVKIIANFETTLVSKLTTVGTTFDLVSNLDADGNALASGTYGFTLDEGQTNEEHLVGTVASSTVTVTLRNVQRNDGETAQTGLEHRKGGTVKITNFPSLKRVIDVLDGTTDLDADTRLKYDAEPTFTLDSNELVTWKKSKDYTDSVAVSGAPDASVTVKGNSEEATLAEINADTGAGGTSARLFVNPSTLRTSEYGVQLPTSDEKDALDGTGTPATGNKFVTADTIANKPDNIDTQTAGETIAGATTPVACYMDNSDDEWYACDANDQTKLEFQGFAITAGTDGNPIDVQFEGIVSGFTGLTKGAKYYVSDTGTMTTTIGTYEVYVGIALSTTEILIDKGASSGMQFMGSLTDTADSITVPASARFVTLVLRAYLSTGSYSNQQEIFLSRKGKTTATTHDSSGGSCGVGSYVISATASWSGSTITIGYGGFQCAAMDSASATAYFYR